MFKLTKIKGNPPVAGARQVFRVFKRLKNGKLLITGWVWKWPRDKTKRGN